MYEFRVKKTKLRNRLVKYLIKNKIDAKIHYPIPMHLQPAAKDYKYKKAQTLIKKTGIDKIDDSIKYIYKIEKKLVESTYNQENSKRFIIAMKQKLQA